MISVFLKPLVYPVIFSRLEEKKHVDYQVLFVILLCSI